jgi:demethylmenaquinone methyltransferase/2-methoxy-6-polyprenyl-1,4-benzoquinol methylase
MFDSVARRYDRMNALASLGRERRWRQAVGQALAPRPGELVLDLAAGTGSSADALARSGAVVVGLDLSLGMLLEGRRRFPGLPLVQGDALKLPFPEGTFAAATICFGLRNVNDPVLALEELRRVVVPGGRLLICEFSRPTNPLLRLVYRRWIKSVLPLLAKLASTDPAAYVYLTESILEWPDQRTLARWVERAGWTGIEWRDLSGGIVALHRARRPD